jgi:replicative DNA helicase
VNWLYDAGDQIVKDNSQRSIASMIKESKAIADMSLRRDMGFEIHDATKEILEKARDNLNISTGYQLLDAALGGGLIRPSFNIVSASSGDGKSIFLQNMAINFIQKGENVIFYTLELEPFIIQQRFAAMMTNTDIGLIMNYLTDVDNEMRMRIDTHGDGLCYVVKFPMVGTTVADIEAHYRDLKAETGLEFSAICVDYLDVMQPIRKVDMGDIHNKDRLLSEEFNDFLHDANLIGFTASQQVKGAQDEKDARQSGVSGGREKVSTADNLWIAKRSMEDKENERWWIHIKKMRSGGGNNVKVPFNWNSKTQRITDGPFELFEKTNPFFYGRKRVTTVDTNPRLVNDSIVQSSGVLEELSKPEDDAMEAKKKKSSDVMHRIMGEIGKERI